MEKLIELLNEYEKTLGDYGLRWDFYDRGYHRGEEGYYYSELQLVSKSFGFIEWLVENDKIDTDPIRTRVKRVYVEFEPREFTPQDFVDRVIMLLSISDTPLNDLFQLLK